jgi:dynein heavy chain
MELYFVVFQAFDVKDLGSAPKEGAYISQMLLENAKWDVQAGSLAEPDPLALYSTMPITHFKPVSKKKAATEAEAGGIYHCPLYIYPLRVGRDRSSFVIWVDLKSGPFDHAFWTKRGTALLLSTS